MDVYWFHAQWQSNSYKQQSKRNKLTTEKSVRVRGWMFTGSTPTDGVIRIGRKEMEGQFLYQRTAAPVLPWDAAGTIGVVMDLFVSLYVVCSGTLEYVAIQFYSHVVYSVYKYELKNIFFLMVFILKTRQRVSHMYT
jgi:hypothetical protein